MFAIDVRSRNFAMEIKSNHKNVTTVVFSKNKLAIGVKKTNFQQNAVYAEPVTYVQTVGERGGKGV